MLRDRKFFDVVWLHMDTTHPVYSAAVVAMRIQHESTGSFKLSINLKKDGLEALIKVVGVASGWAAGKLWKPAILRTFTETDHAEIIFLVRDFGWEDPPVLDPA